MGKRQNSKAIKTSEGLPKKPMSSFFIYAGERRPVLKKERENLSTGKISTLIGKEWKALSEEQKLVYQNKAVKAKEVYKKAMVDYLDK